jgi:hypothetical protein
LSPAPPALSEIREHRHALVAVEAVDPLLRSLVEPSRYSYLTPSRVEHLPDEREHLDVNCENTSVRWPPTESPP